MTVSANNEKLTTISKNANVATLINVFTVEPENQQRLVELLVEVTEDVMCKISGFVCANIHQSLDGKWVTNYAQWKSVESFKNMRESVKIMCNISPCLLSSQRLLRNLRRYSTKFATQIIPSAIST